MSVLAFAPRLQYLDADGIPRTGALANFYVTGTTTRANTYSDSGLTTPHANPVVQLSNGYFPPIYLDPAVTYKLVLTDSGGANAVTVDPLNATLTQAELGAILYPRTASEIAASVTPTYYYYPPGDVRRYGAVGDGSTDDATAVTRAANSGHAVVLEAGKTYLLSGWTALTPAGVLRITGNGATLKGPVAATNFLSPTTNFDIRGVTFDRWASVVSRLEAATGSFTDVAFIGNRCTNCTGRVFDIERPVEWYRIEGNDFDTCSGGYAVHIGANTYASQDTWTKGIVKGNRFKTLSASGTTSAAAILIYGREVEISGNVIDGVTQSGTGEAWGIYTKVRYGRVFDNYVNNVVPAGSGDNVGINIKGNTRTATGVPQGFANLVYGNHVRNIGVAGSKGSGIRVQTDDVHVYGNLVEDPGTNCYVSDESSVYRNVRIENNLGQYASLVAGTAGIRIEGYGKNVVATGNTILNATNGAVVTANFTSLTDAALIGNIFDGCTNNIVFDASAACTLDRLRIDDNVVNSGTVGVLFNGSAGTVSNLRLRGNDLARAATAVSGSLGTSATVSGNVGFLSGSATYDPASLVDGAGATTTVTCTGAVLGDLARASFSLDLQGITLTAWVSSANTVSVRFQNESGGTLDLASGTLRVTCER